VLAARVLQHAVGGQLLQDRSISSMR
jgi:hypothetical protein